MIELLFLFVATFIFVAFVAINKYWQASSNEVRKRIDRITRLGCIAPVALVLLTFLAGIISDAFVHGSGAYVSLAVGLFCLVVLPILYIVGVIWIFWDSRRRQKPPDDPGSKAGT